MANNSQHVFWCGQGGANWVKKKDTIDDMLDPFGQAAMKRLNVLPSSTIVDIGCGSGATTFQLAHQLSSNGFVTGIDISKPLLDHARSLNHFSNVRFIEEDLQTSSHSAGSFTHAFSRFGVMFFDDSVAAFSTIQKLLKPGGMLSFICWQTAQQNLWQTLILKEIKKSVDIPDSNPRTPGPFAFGNRDYVQSILTESHFQNIQIESYERPVTIFRGYSPEDAVTEMLALNPALQFLKDYPENEQAVIKGNVVTAYSKYQNDEGFEFPSAAWIVTANTPSQ